MKICQFLDQNPDYQLHLAGKRASQVLNLSLEPFQINLTQALILVALFFEQDHLSNFEDLAFTFEMTKGGLSQHLSLLEGRFLVSRLQKEGDRRSSVVKLQEDGVFLCPKLIKIFDCHQKQIESTFGEAELKLFLENLRRLARPSES